MSVWDVFTRDSYVTNSGGVTLTQGKATLRRNAVGTWIVEASWSDELWSRVDRGTGLVIRRGGRRLCNGPVIAFGYETVLDDEDELLTVIRIEGVTDEIVLADRMVLPDPSRGYEDQTTTTHWRMTGPAESVMLALVDQQAGPSASPGRRTPGLTVAADRGRGPVITVEIRYGAPNMLAELQTIATRAGLGFQVVPTATGRRFEVQLPRQRSADIRFGADVGNVGEQSYRLNAPTRTLALWQGQNTGMSRMQRAYATTDPDALAWGRLIEYVGDGRDTDDPAQLVERATDEVADGGPAVSFSFEPLETATTRYQETYDIGDEVTVYPGPPGSRKLGQFVDLIREVSVETDGDTDRVRAAVGSEGAATGVPLPSDKQLTQINADLRALQRSD